VRGNNGEWTQPNLKIIGCAYAEDDVFGSFDGANMTDIATDSSYDISTDSMTTFVVGASRGGANQLNGYASDIKFYDVRKSNTFVNSNTT
jgi:hypothetical protein